MSGKDVVTAMRCLSLLYAVAACTGLCSCALASPSVEFEKVKVDAGDVCPGKMVAGTFVFRNAGDTELHIIGIDKSCDCTVAKPESSSLKPGESSKIALAYVAPGGGGQVSKTITLVTDDPVQEGVRLELVATVIPIASCTPGRLNFGTVKPGTILEKTVIVTPVAAEGFKLEAVKCAGTCVSIPEFRPTDDGKGSYSLKIVIKAGDTPGRVLELVRIKANVPGAEVPLLVFGNIVK